MDQGWGSLVCRGRTRFVSPEDYRRGGLGLDGCRNGMVFADAEGRTFLEYYCSHREKFFEMLWRNPLLEFARTLDKRYMDTLFATIVSFSRHRQRASFVAGMTFGYNPVPRDLRVREVARDMAASAGGAAIKRLMSVEIMVVAQALQARRLVAETFPAYGAHLLKQGWVESSSGRPWSIRVGAALNRDRCYVCHIEEGEHDPGT